MQFSPQKARQVAINCQLLGSKAKIANGKEGAMQVIEKLGYIQIDTLAVIQRAHNHTLWTRLPDYKPEFLSEMLSKDRSVFEYWGHARSYLPISDYRFYLPRMRDRDDPYLKWEKKRLEKYGSSLKGVLERIRKEGPLGPSDFKPISGKKNSTFDSRDPNTSALELLHLQGELMITRRRNFERVFDLTERVLPKDIDTRMPTENDLGRFLVKRALLSYGIATEKEIKDHIRVKKKAVYKSAINDLCDSTDVIKLRLKDDPKTEYFALAAIIKDAQKLKNTNPLVHILSPFDNFIIQRDRIKRLFGFEYALECYVPAKKRKFGYFVLPILWGEEFAGRIDIKANRKNKTFIIRNIIFEKCFSDFDEFLTIFAKKLWAFARFNDCDNIEVVKTSPARIKKPLENQLKC